MNMQLDLEFPLTTHNRHLPYRIFGTNRVNHRIHHFVFCQWTTQDVARELARIHRAKQSALQQNLLGLNERYPPPRSLKTPDQIDASTQARSGRCVRYHRSFTISNRPIEPEVVKFRRALDMNHCVVFE